MPGSDSQQRQSGPRLDFMEGDTQTSAPSNGAPTLYFDRFVVLGELAPSASIPADTARVRKRISQQLESRRFWRTG